MPAGGGAGSRRAAAGADPGLPEWRAEVVVDEPLVRRLLEEQFPALDVGSARPFAEGWDNALWLVNDTIAFRFPRRAIAVPGLEREIGVLPALSGFLPLPIPTPAYVGRASDAFPWPFFGAQLLVGRELASAPLDGRRAGLGAGLGSFLDALHDRALLVRHGADLPVDPMGRADMSMRVPRTRERLERLASAGLWTPTPAVEAILDAANELGSADGLVLCHGDLNVRHLLVDDAGVPAAVIDWGDVCVGDPSIDLSLYWSLLDAAGRAAFREAYGAATLTDERLLRARVLSLFMNAALAQYADDIGDAELLAETLAGLGRTLVDD
jgi:aminoglycoside phosphotransferase (APT) family kinase protein